VIGIIERGLRDGKSFDTIAREIRDSKFIGINKERAKLIAQTETNRAFNEGSRRYMKDLGITHYQVSLAIDACRICLDRYTGGTGTPTIFEIDNVDDIPPAHPRCRCVIVAVIPEAWLQDENAQMNFDKLSEPNIVGGRVVSSGNLYNKELERILAAYQSKRLDETQFKAQLQGLVDNIPTDEKLRQSILNIADLYGVKPSRVVGEANRYVDAVNKELATLGIDTKLTGITPFEAELLDKSFTSVVKMETTDLTTAAGYNNATNQLLLNVDRLNRYAKYSDLYNPWKRTLHHEIGHLIDHRLGFVTDYNIRFSIDPVVTSTLQADQDNIVKWRVINTSSANVRKELEGWGPDLWRNYLSGQKVGNYSIPASDLAYMKRLDELFAEGWTVYINDPTYLRAKAPALFNLYNNIANAKFK
jgi:SPP1 gp7 family putative phage head morphogenesis protein